MTTTTRESATAAILDAAQRELRHALRDWQNAYGQHADAYDDAERQYFRGRACAACDMFGMVARAANCGVETYSARKRAAGWTRELDDALAWSKNPWKNP